MRYILIFLLLSFSLISVHAQQEMVIAGLVLNSKTSEPIPFANIGIKGTAIGTVSNNQGSYELHLNSGYKRTDSLVVSCVGHGVYSIAISNIRRAKEHIIYLRPKAYLLNSVTVRPQELSAEDIMEIAIRRISINYVNKPHLSDGFYREYFKENGHYAAFAESAVSIYDAENYNFQDIKDRESIKINQLRVSDIYNKGDYVLYIDLHYALRGNVMRNTAYWKKYIKRAKYKLESLTMDSISYHGNDLVYCISYQMYSKRKGTYNGRFYVRTRDFAILRAEINAYNRLRGKQANGLPQESKTVMTYKDHRGKLYLSYINASHTVKFKSKKEDFNLYFYSELLINNIQTDDFNPIVEEDAMDTKSIFYQPRYRTYDEDYWKSYNQFENSEANDSIVSDLERYRPLEKQYMTNGKMKIKPRKTSDKKYEIPVNDRTYGIRRKLNTNER
ncbi:MAG: carboxypeptidase-like regulatory domain-containing protein [Chitinophagales bacterium]